MQRSFTLAWVLDLASLVIFPLAAVHVSRRWNLWGLGLLWAAWAGSLIGYGAWLGAPEMSTIMIGIPLSGAAAVAWQTRSVPPTPARRRAVLVTIALFVPSVVVGFVWGVMACQGGCL